MIEAPAVTCPACGRKVYFIDRSYEIGDGHRIRSVDRTLRHCDDGTVGVLPDGTVVCEKVVEE